MKLLNRLEQLRPNRPAYQVIGESGGEQKTNILSRAEQEKRDKKIAKAIEKYLIDLFKEKLHNRYKNWISLLTYTEFQQVVIDVINGLKQQTGLPPDVDPDYIEYGVWGGGGSPRSTMALGTNGRNFKVETQDAPHVRVYVEAIQGQPEVIENGPRLKYFHCVRVMIAKNDQ